MSVTRLQKIRDAVREFGTSSPESDTDDLFWYSPDREYPDYYRLSRMGEDTAPLYDIWADVKAEFDRGGFLQVRAKAVLYDVRGNYEVMSETVFDRGFGGTNQPLEQTFLNNMVVYEEKLQKQLDQFVDQAESMATEVEQERVTA